MNRIKVIVLATITTISAATVQAQNIFTYGNTPVSKQEFYSMYTKNTMNKKVDLSATALRDYVKLYSRFKMKVAEAEAARIDTLPSIKAELENYKKQLAKNYLTDKEVISALVKETYEHSKKDVQIAHIMIAMPKGSNDSTAALKMIDSLYTALNAGANFDEMAQKMSQDKSTAAKGGNIGYITTLQTPYEFEAMAYATPVNKISKPFRTTFGYHIIKKLAERPAIGEVVVSQIMREVRKSMTDAQKQSVKITADSIYKQLKKGVSWADMVTAFSQDKYSVSNNGDLQAFGVNTMATSFEDAAFALKIPGDIAQPVLTEYGYHIIKLTKKITLRPFDSVQAEITKKIERDGRSDMARVAFINKIKTKGAFVETPQNLTNFINSIPDSAIKSYSLNWSQKKVEDRILFSIKNKNYTTIQFFEHIMNGNRGRINGDKTAAIKAIYNQYAEKAVMEFAENNLAVDNKEFKSMLKEYRDGIILFELTDKKVWTKASTDSIGLADYYEKNKAKYQWGPSFEGRIVRANVFDNLVEYVKLMNTMSKDSALSIINNGEMKITTEDGKFEYEKLDDAAKGIAAGSYSGLVKGKDGSGTMYMPTKITMSPSQKSMSDARGYIIADYQDYLEKSWINSMEAKYPVKVNEAVLKTLIK
jgi:peptidyl-prolyl cis-trans isomerase SurA